MSESQIVADTNVFVASGFNPESHSARIVRMIRAGDWRLAWNDGTRKEIEHTVRRIPVLSNDVLNGIFREEDRHRGKVDPSPFDYIADPADRKFAALAVAAGVPLVSSDDHLLMWRDRIPVPVLTPGDFLRRHGESLE